MPKLTHNKNNINENYTDIISNLSDWPKLKSFTTHSWQGWWRNRYTTHYRGTMFYYVRVYCICALFNECIVCVCDTWSPLKHGFWSRDPGWESFYRVLRKVLLWSHLQWKEQGGEKYVQNVRKDVSFFSLITKVKPYFIFFFLSIYRERKEIETQG